LCRRSAARNGSDPREKNVQLEWFGEIVVRAGVQPVHDVGPSVARRNDNNGCLKPSLPQFPKNAQTIQAGKHDVEQNYVDVGRQTHLESSIAIVGKQDGMPITLERSAQQIGRIRSVFGY
jgi:hypothetical protein